jgi:hypothetical protein
MPGLACAGLSAQIVTVGRRCHFTIDEDRLVTSEPPRGQRYLVRHDYGMGALWWWIRAGSAAEITTAFAEVEVIDDPATVHTAGSWSLDELDIADAVSGPLGSLRSKRADQRQDPAFGRLLGKDRVYLRLPDPDEPASWWLTEHDSAGRRVRQIELRKDGTAVTSTSADWPMNRRSIFGDPQFAAHEISRQEFEQAWEHATRNEK